MNRGDVILVRFPHPSGLRECRTESCDVAHLLAASPRLFGRFAPSRHGVARCR
jgi:hypothetical protein